MPAAGLADESSHLPRFKDISLGPAARYFGRMTVQNDSPQGSLFDLPLSADSATRRSVDGAPVSWANEPDSEGEGNFQARIIRHSGTWFTASRWLRRLGEWFRRD